MPDNGRSWIEINMNAYESNIRLINQKLNGQSKLMAVVKDRAYGLGIEAVKRLQELGIDFFAVSCIDEAIELRQENITQKILILTKTSEARIHEVIEFKCIQAVHSLEYAEKINMVCQQLHRKLTCHLKVDTGMNRIGFRIDSETCDISELLQTFRMENLDIQGIFTHLHAADDPSIEAKKETLRQFNLFDKVLFKLKEKNVNYGCTHVLNSAGLVNYGDHIYEYARIGLLLCGIGGDSFFHEVVNVKTRISMIKDVCEGEMIGYGLAKITEKSVRVATLPIGYGDGIARILYKKNYFFTLNENKVPLIGRICMDQCMINVCDISCSEGDIVTVIGDKSSILEMSSELDTIPNEILVQLNSRLPRYYLNDQKQTD